MGHEPKITEPSMTETEAQDPREAEVSAAAQLLTAVPAQALARLRVLAAQGSARAMRYLAHTYQHGVGPSCPSDLEEATHWYCALLPSDPAAALAGFTDIAHQYVGRREFSRARATLLSGLDAGVPPPLDLLDKINAWERWEAEPDAPEYQRAIAALKTDVPSALDAFRSMACMGSALSMIQLGAAYRRGLGVAVNLEEAAAWYRRALEKGERTAPYFLGLVYLQQANYRAAFDAFAIGAALDEPTALYDLGILCRRGLGVAKQVGKARCLFERASALGNILAQRDLALLYLAGHAGPRYRLRGLRLLLMASRDIFRIYKQTPDTLRLYGQIAYFHPWRYRKRRS